MKGEYVMGALNGKMSMQEKRGLEKNETTYKYLIGKCMEQTSQSKAAVSQIVRIMLEEMEKMLLEKREVYLPGVGLLFVSIPKEESKYHFNYYTQAWQWGKRRMHVKFKESPMFFRKMNGLSVGYGFGNKA